jgi:hypothetical protein
MEEAGGYLHRASQSMRQFQIRVKKNCWTITICTRQEQLQGHNEWKLTESDLFIYL